MFALVNVSDVPHMQFDKHVWRVGEWLFAAVTILDRPAFPGVALRINSRWSTGDTLYLDGYCGDPTAGSTVLFMKGFDAVPEVLGLANADLSQSTQEQRAKLWKSMFKVLCKEGEEDSKAPLPMWIINMRRMTNPHRACPNPQCQNNDGWERFGYLPIYKCQQCQTYLCRHCGKKPDDKQSPPGCQMSDTHSVQFAFCAYTL